MVGKWLRIDDEPVKPGYIHCSHGELRAFGVAEFGGAV
jgi:hypothetical protein